MTIDEIRARVSEIQKQQIPQDALQWGDDQLIMNALKNIYIPNQSFLLSTIKALLQCDEVMREALKELDMDCREIRISALSKNARNALAHRNKILGGLK